MSCRPAPDWRQACSRASVSAGLSVMVGAGAWAWPGHGRDFHAAVTRAARFVLVGTDWLLRAEGSREDRIGREARLDQGAGDGERALRGQFPVVGVTAVAAEHRAIVGEAA